MLAGTEMEKRMRNYLYPDKRRCQMEITRQLSTAATAGGGGWGGGEGGGGFPAKPLRPPRVAW